MNSLASRLRALLVAVCLAVVFAVAAGPAACHPQPPSPSGPVTTVSSWTDTARTVLSTARGARRAAPRAARGSGRTDSP